MSTIKSSAENLTLNADGANNDIKFQSNGSEVASIDQAGTITATTFTGAATDVYKLPLAGGTMSGNLVVNADIDMTGVLNGTSGSMDIKNEANGENIFIKTTSGGSEVTALKIHSGGTIELGTGQGLRVSGTAAANTLDDYEEGTFTASMTGSSSAPNSAVTATGRYTKIGNFVFWSIHRFSSFNSTGASGSIQITGMPFAADHSVVYSTFATHHMNFDAAKFQWGEQGASGTTIDFLESQNGGAWQNWNITAGTGLYMSLSGNYRAE